MTILVWPKEASTPQEKISVKKAKGATVMDKKRSEGQRDMLLTISGTKTVASKKEIAPVSKPKGATRKAG